MRLFTALLIPDAVRDAALAVQERLKATDADVRWSVPENLHLTVTFLGDLDNGLLPDIQTACETIAAETSPFRIRLAGTSTFPKRGPSIKTIFLAVTEGAEEWRSLVQRSEPWWTPYNVAREGGLVAHLTLGRVRSERNMTTLREAIAAEKDTDCGTLTADRLTLVQSILDPKGATYEERGSWSFQS